MQRSVAGGAQPKLVIAAEPNHEVEGILFSDAILIPRNVGFNRPIPIAHIRPANFRGIAEIRTMVQARRHDQLESARESVQSIGGALRRQVPLPFRAQNLSVKFVAQRSRKKSGRGCVGGGKGGCKCVGVAGS